MTKLEKIINEFIPEFEYNRENDVYGIDAENNIRCELQRFYESVKHLFNEERIVSLVYDEGTSMFKTNADNKEIESAIKKVKKLLEDEEIEHYEYFVKIEEELSPKTFQHFNPEMFRA